MLWARRQPTPLSGSGGGDWRGDLSMFNHYVRCVGVKLPLPLPLHLGWPVESRGARTCIFAVFLVWLADRLGPPARPKDKSVAATHACLPKNSIRPGRIQTPLRSCTASQPLLFRGRTAVLWTSQAMEPDAPPVPARTKQTRMSHDVKEFHHKRLRSTPKRRDKLRRSQVKCMDVSAVGMLHDVVADLWNATMGFPVDPPKIGFRRREHSSAHRRGSFRERDSPTYLLRI
jgi:hypothetical protein